MLNLTRMEGEAIVVDGPCRFIINHIERGRVTIGIVAKPEVRIVRSELLAQDHRTNTIIDESWDRDGV